MLLCRVEPRPQQNQAAAGSFSFGTPSAQPGLACRPPQAPLQPPTPAAAHPLSPAGPPSQADSPWDVMLGPCPAPIPTPGSMSLPSDISDGFDDSDFFQDDLTSPSVHPLRQSHSSTPAEVPLLGLADTAAAPQSPAKATANAAAAAAAPKPPAVGEPEVADAAVDAGDFIAQMQGPVGGAVQPAAANDEPKPTPLTGLQQQASEGDMHREAKHGDDQEAETASAAAAVQDAAAPSQPDVRLSLMNEPASSADQVRDGLNSAASQQPPAHEGAAAGPAVPAAPPEPTPIRSPGEAPLASSPLLSRPLVDFSADCPIFAADVIRAPKPSQPQAGMQSKLRSSSRAARTQGHDPEPQAGGESRAAKKARRDVGTQLRGSTHPAELHHASQADGLEGLPAADKGRTSSAPASQADPNGSSGQPATRSKHRATSAARRGKTGGAPTLQPTRTTRSGQTATARAAPTAAGGCAPIPQPITSCRPHHPHTRAGKTRFSMESNPVGDFATPPTHILAGGAEPLRGAFIETPQGSLDRYADAATPDPMGNEQAAGMSSDDDHCDDGLMYDDPDNADDIAEHGGPEADHAEGAREAAHEPAGHLEPAHPSGKALAWH